MIFKSYEIQKNYSRLTENNFFLCYGENFGLFQGGNIGDISITYSPLSSVGGLTGNTGASYSATNIVVEESNKKLSCQRRKW